MNRRLFAAIGLSLTLAACATPYNGGKMGAMGGVEAQFITNDTARISARGNAYTDKARMTDFVLLKAAETAKERGFSHFAIISADDASRAGTITTPGTMQTTVYGNTAYSTYSPGANIPYVKPGQDAFVRFCKGSCGGMMRASEIISNMGPKYLSAEQ